MAFGLLEPWARGSGPWSLVALDLVVEILSYSVLTYGVLGAGAGAVAGFAAFAVVHLGRILRLHPTGESTAAALATASLAVLWGGYEFRHDAARLWVLLASVICAVVCYWIFDRACPATLRVLRSTSTRLILASLLIGAAVCEWHVRPGTDGSRMGIGSRAPAVAPKERTNVVIVVLDTLRADRLGVYGSSQRLSPSIDAFAREATVFEDVESPAAWTLPAHASLFTGLFVSEHGTTSRAPRLRDEAVTLAELLAGAGYETLCLSNNPWISPATGLTRGCERSFIPDDVLPKARLARALFRRFLKPLSLPTWIYAWFDEDKGAFLTNQVVARWLQKRERNRPFFLFLNYMETHSPYTPALRHRLAVVDPPQLRASYRLHQSAEREWVSLLSWDDLAEARRVDLSRTLYDGAVRELDERFGELIGILRESNQLDSTLVVVTADHGEELGEHGMLGHQFGLYRTVTSVPLILRAVGPASARRIPGRVQTTSVFRHVLEAVGLPCRAPGCSRASLLGVGPPGGELTLSEYDGVSEQTLRQIRAQYPTRDLSALARRFVAVSDGFHRVIVGSDGAGALYNVKEDPLELRDLALALPETMGRLRGAALAWQASVSKFGPSEKPRLDQDLRDRLRALGYVQ